MASFTPSLGGGADLLRIDEFETINTAVEENSRGYTYKNIDCLKYTTLAQMLQDLETYPFLCICVYKSQSSGGGITGSRASFIFNGISKNMLLDTNIMDISLKAYAGVVLAESETASNYITMYIRPTGYYYNGSYQGNPCGTQVGGRVYFTSSTTPDMTGIIYPKVYVYGIK